MKAGNRVHYDAPTQLPERVLFEELLIQAVNQSRRQDRILALLWIGIQFPDDKPKGREGAARDQLLRAASQRIKSTLRESDVAARVGAMEMAVAFTGLMSPGDAERATQRLHAELVAPVTVDGVSLTPVVHTGISLYPVDGADVGKLMADADAARQEVAADSLSEYQFASPDIKATAVDRMALEESLDRALIEKELVLYYQPQFDLFTGEVVGLETLVQWAHPELGLLPARHWMPMAEDFGRGVDIGVFVLDTATRQYREWLSQGCGSFELCLNVSSGWFQNRKFTEMVQGALAASNMDPQLLVLEFSEDSIIRSADVAFRALTRLSDMGVRISIDDFGSGYASLTQLKIYPFHGLKIDRSLVSNIENESNDKSILKAVIAMAHEMGLVVTAVGVESNAQEEILKRAKCDRVQGFLLGRPVPAGEVPGLLHS